MQSDEVGATPFRWPITGSIASFQMQASNSVVRQKLKGRFMNRGDDYK